MTAKTKDKKRDSGPPPEDSTEIQTADMRQGKNRHLTQFTLFPMVGSRSRFSNEDWGGGGGGLGERVSVSKLVGYRSLSSRKILSTLFFEMARNAFKTANSFELLHPL